MKSLLRMSTLAVLLTLLVVSISQTTISYAHEGKTAGPYAIELGWRIEPAYVGVKNGPEVFISMKDDESKKVEGADKTLKLKVSFGGKSKDTALKPAWNDPGHYVADLIPTRAGDYTFELTGKIGDTEINLKFTSADGHFSAAEPTGDILFPDTRDPEIQSLQDQIDALKKEVDALKAKK